MTEVSRRKFLQWGGGAFATASLASAVAACGGSSSASGPLKLSNDKVTWKNWFAAEGTAAKVGSAGFQPTEYADTTTYQAAINSTGLTPKVPDMFTWWSGWLMKDLVSKGMLADLSSIWQQNASAYSPDVREAFTFNGKQYGVTLNLAYWVTFYNKQVFAQHGLSAPTTWDEFTGACSKLKAAGVTPLAATIASRWPSFDYFQEFMIRQDPALYTALVAGKAKYTDPGVADVMSLWGSMIKKGWFSDPSAVSLGTGADNFTQYFKTGKIAMATFGSWLEPEFVAAGMKPNVDYGSFVMPNIAADAGNNLIFETAPLCVAQHGPRQADALKAAAWFASKAGQQEWIKATGFSTPRSDVTSGIAVDQDIDKTIKSGGYKLLNRYWEATPHDIVEVAVDQFAKFMLNPGDPMPILQAIQKQADQSWASLS